MGNYESLAGGMVAAGAALFAGWLAWSAVQVQIAAEERRAAADRIEVEQVLQGDLDTFAEALGAIWKILERYEQAADPQVNRTKLEGVIYGIEQITKEAWLSSSRQMVTALGWQRRRDYDELFAELERLERYRDINAFNVDEALAAVRRVGIEFQRMCPDTARYFEGRFQRAGKAYSLGYAIEVQEGVAVRERASFEPSD